MRRNDDKKLYKRKVGRPMWSGERVSKCDVRLNAEENDMLNELAELHEVSRSDVVRKAIKDYYKYNTEE